MSLYVNIPATSTAVSTTAATALGRAQTLLGATITRVNGLEFGDTAGFTATVAGTGTAALSTTQLGGVINVASGATLGGTSVVRPAGAPGLVTNPTTALWYLRCTATLTTVDAQTYISVGLSYVGSSAGLFLGGIGTRSITHFAYDFYTNAGVSTVNGSLGVALDTSAHLYEMWADLTNINVAMDGTTRLTVAIPATTTNPSNWRFDASNGTTNANKQIAANDIWICTAES